MTTKTPQQPVLVCIFQDRLIWAVRILQQGERYGKNDRLVYEKDEQCVEFYDTRYPFSPLGQFVSRYPLSTLMAPSYGQGLCLDCGVPDWDISGDCLCKVQDWISGLELIPSPE